MKRCKPGDLALVIGSSYPENIMKVVEVLRPTPAGDIDDWVIVSNGPLMTEIGWVTDWATTPDSGLLPIRPQHDEAEETERVTEAIHHADGDANNNAMDNLRVVRYSE